MAKVLFCNVWYNIARSMKKIHTKSPTVLQAIIYLFTIVLFKIFCRFEVRGLENLKQVGQKVIFASNHGSEWDGILIRTSLPFFSRWTPMYYVALTKEKYINSGWRQILYGGRLFELLGAYVTYSGRKDYAYSLQNYLQILAQGKSVCIFPEGKRTRDGKIGPARGGLGFLSHETDTSVIPVAIYGTTFFSTKEMLLRRRKVIVQFGEAILPETIGSGLVRRR